jgi:exosome complex RNA-binding protein Rrp4
MWPLQFSWQAFHCVRRSQAVAPGDIICQLPETGEVRVGSGVQLSSTQLCSVKAGILRQTTSGKLWIEGRQKR